MLHLETTVGRAFWLQHSVTAMTPIPPNLIHFKAIKQNSERQPDICAYVCRSIQRRGCQFQNVLCEIEFNLTGNFFFFSLGSHFVSLLLASFLYFSICHFNYGTAYYFYALGAIFRNTKERAVQILGDGSSD